MNECTSTKASEQIRERSCNSLQWHVFMLWIKQDLKVPMLCKTHFIPVGFFFNNDMPLACQSDFKRYLTNSNEENLKDNQSKLIALVELILM